MIDEDRLAEVLCREIPGCNTLVSAELLSGGASQETYRLTFSTAQGVRQVALRRAPSDRTDSGAEKPGLDVEAELFRLAANAGVPEPQIYYQLVPGDGLGQGMLMEWVEGETLGARIVRSPTLAEVRPKLAFECGQILARIHSIDVTGDGLDQRLRVVSPRELLDLTWDHYRSLKTPQPMIDFTARWLIDHLPGDVAPSLVHSDFRNGNLMVTTSGVVAVLDWELAHLGDPMRDLGWLCVNSWRFGGDLPVGGFGLREDLFAGYESVAGHRVEAERVHFWEIFGSFWWATHCLTMGQQYRDDPQGQGVERPAIARRSSECQMDCVNLIIPGPIALVEADPAQGSDLPRVEELVASVRTFLHDQVMEQAQARTRFLARVATNALDIVHRDLALGRPSRALEAARLRELLGAPTGRTLEEMRWALVDGLREGSITTDTPGLHHHLRQSVANQLAIDQPRYSALRQAHRFT